MISRRWVGPTAAGVTVAACAVWSVVGVVVLVDNDVPTASLAGLVAPAATAATTTPTSSPALDQGGAPTPVPPWSVSVPAVDLTARVVPIAFDDATLVPPADVNTVGWWSDGGLPGETSGQVERPVVLVGHVSDESDAPGAFAALPRVEVGDQITVRLAQQPTTYVVTRLQRVAKDRFPRSVFVDTDSGSLRLITCTTRISAPGGGFHYQQNLIVHAAPARGAASLRSAHEPHLSHRAASRSRDVGGVAGVPPRDSARQSVRVEP